jgi:hypothetical protein
MTLPTGQREDLGESFQDTPEAWRELLEKSGLTVSEEAIYELSESGWVRADNFTPAGVRYGTRGKYASAVLCIHATRPTK